MQEPSVRPEPVEGPLPRPHPRPPAPPLSSSPPNSSFPPRQEPRGAGERGIFTTNDRLPPNASPTARAIPESPIPDHALAHALTPPPLPRRHAHATVPAWKSYATSSNRPSPARSASMAACGSAPNSRELFQHRGAFLHLLCSCNASHQLQSKCKYSLSTATRRRKNIASLRYVGGRKKFALTAVPHPRRRPDARTGAAHLG